MRAKFSPVDEKWMRRALELARKGLGAVHPNPMVGAVLVKNGRVVGEGYHRAYGQPHAEVEALRRAGTRARGATLYVTLEPCSHWGKTPPCVNALLDSGIRHVVAAMKDPNPLVAGKGFALLKRSGVAITVDVEREAAQHLNRAFVHWVTTRRPFVTVKKATSIDGKTATLSGESKWITSPEARAAGHRLRVEADAIAIGSRTAVRDNPGLSAHHHGRDPIRVVFDRHLRVPRSHRLMQPGPRTWIFTGHDLPPAKRRRFEEEWIRIEALPQDRRGRLSVQEALKRLGAAGVTHLLVEGGLTLQQSFFEEDLVDEVAWFVAPLWIGSRKALKDATPFQPFHARSVGPDAWLTTSKR